jgi:hypothetical protein
MEQLGSSGETGPQRGGLLRRIILGDPTPQADNADRRTGYYVAGRDWPAIANNIPLEEMYRALEGITDEAVAAAMDSLAQTVGPEEAPKI